MRVKRADVLITRGPLEVVPKTVFHHEIPILESLFDMVAPADEKGRAVDHWVDGKDYPWEELAIDLIEERQRLENSYGVDNSGDPWVDVIYGHPRNKGIERFYEDLEKEEKRLEDLEASGVGPKNLGGNMIMTPSMMTVSAIKAALTEMKIDFPRDAGKMDLEKMLESALMEMDGIQAEGGDFDDSGFDGSPDGQGEEE